MAMHAAGKSDWSSPLPLLYNNPVVITGGQHARARFKRARVAEFASGADAIPLVLSDVPEAAKHYPIAFTTCDIPMPVALVGLEKQNYFIEEGGDWRSGRYVPSFLRNYPFLFVQAPDDQLFLAIDEPCLASPDDADGLPLFSGDTLSSHTIDALRFCEAYREQYDKTIAFGQALAEAKLLTPHAAKVELHSGRRIITGGFLSFDPDWIVSHGVV